MDPNIITSIIAGTLCGAICFTPILVILLYVAIRKLPQSRKEDPKARNIMAPVDITGKKVWKVEEPGAKIGLLNTQGYQYLDLRGDKRPINLSVTISKSTDIFGGENPNTGDIAVVKFSYTEDGVEKNGWDIFVITEAHGRGAADSFYFGTIGWSHTTEECPF